jgi:outer membrane lipoprotein-sorting protein
MAACNRGGSQEVTAAALQAKADRVAAFRARVESEVVMGGREMRMQGSIRMLRPDKIRVEMFDDRGSLVRVVVQRGNLLMQHDLLRQQVTSLDLARVEEVTGRRPPGAQGTDIGRPFDGMVADAMTYLETRERDGAPVHLFEGPLANVDALTVRLGFRPAKARVWVDATTGLLRRTEVIGADGETTLSQDFSAIEIDPPLDEEIFHLQPPAGVKAVDMTDGTIRALSAPPQ